MPAAFIYLLKLSVSLGVVFLFYQLVLRRLTFYNWNRLYLLAYTLFSFVIPFIDITPALHENELNNAAMVQWVPILYNRSTGNSSLSIWNVLSLIVVAGMLVMLIRLLVQLFSFRRMMKKAKLISGEDVSLYQVDEPIIPFSFGNAVFFNINLHTTEELEKIIRHEFVHVKQLHSIDIITGEILCLLNWYNPFAWLLKSAIRQNLEFVADNKVLENGINKKQYQYLLLKVIGNNQFSIAQKFNFSSLKKRIAMMNKSKSAKMHLLRFLFLLPVLAVILVSFRKEIGDTLTGKQKQLQPLPAAVIDTVPIVTTPNSKGYIINVKDQKGECVLVIKDKTGKEVKRVLLTEWNANAEKFEANYGEIPPPPPPAPPTALPDFVKEIDNNVDWVEVWFKNGEKEREIYDFKIPAQKEAFERKYGNGNFVIPPPPPAPASSFEAPEPPGVFNYPAPPQPPAAPTPVKLPASVQKINISNKKATVTLKNGQKENYDLNNAEQKEKFEKKYGEFVSPPPAKPEFIEVPVKASVIEERKVKSTTQNSVIIEERQARRSSVAIEGNPVVVVDGVITTKAALDNLNPDVIASVDVLKGSSATAAYGDKGSEGAIIVKTKTGTEISEDKMYITAKEVNKSDDRNEVTVYSPDIEMTNSKKLVILDGKELPAGKKKLTGTFNLVTLTKEQAIKKYGEKGKNGVIEITTLK
jgi:TonB-dependent SusC/RagA subfamily outer membrane receptor